MDKLKIVIICIVVIAIAVTLSMIFDKDVTVIDQKTGQPVNVGALSGPDIPYPYISVGGVAVYPVKAAMAATSSTAIMCSLEAPANGTSTLIFASANFTTASSAAMTAGMFKATTAYASTTQVGSDFAIGAGGTGLLVGSTTTGTINNVFAKGEHLNVTLFSGKPTSTKTAPVGVCEAIFVPVQ